MSKIANALEKAGYQEGVQKKDSHIEPVSAQTVQPDTAPRENNDVLPQQSAVSTPPNEQRRASIQTGSWDSRLFEVVHNDIALPEVFKTLRSKLLYPVNGHQVPRTILVTSALPKEGKSFVCANLAISLAKGMEEHALLVDCDLRNPVSASLFGIDNSQGLTDHLRDGIPLAELIRKTTIPKLSLLPAGKRPANPAELLSSMRMRELVEELSTRYEDRLIIFDSPPAMFAAETAVLAKALDMTILVVRQNRTSKVALNKVIESLGRERIRGVVFNDYSPNIVEKTMAKSGGHYHYGYGY